MIAIVIIGPPGSGKTSLGKAVVQDVGIEHISSGDIAREMEQRDPYARMELEKGEMAPENAMRMEVLSQVEAATARSGDFVIDGFPRTMAQLVILESIPSIHPIYFHLDTDPLICLRRIAARNRRGEHPDAIATRWRDYREHTAPLLDILFHHTFTLGGSQPVEVLAEVVVDEYRREYYRRVG